jgi:hypothetical protein
LSADGPGLKLARRLRALRETYWPDITITQGELAGALGDDRPLSVPLISSWESEHNPKVPPPNRLAAYATFFATRRSVQQTPFRMVAPVELTDAERDQRDALLRELTGLRDRARQPAVSAAAVEQRDSVWRFPENETVVIADTELPPELLAKMPNADRDSPDYMELYRYGDPDALIELYGHLRAFNPRNEVHFRTAPMLKTDDYVDHLVVLGGVDWNLAARDLLTRINLPVQQVAREGDDEIGCFEVVEDGEPRTFRPTVERSFGRDRLLEDVALFYRAPNPYNRSRTLTICNGMFGRGTQGVVRALTDATFRESNEAYLRQRFAGLDTFSILTRVSVVAGKAITPDWTKPGSVLHEWPENPS